MSDVRDNAKEKLSPRWDISQERAFIETLLGQRFNFLLVFFSITVAGAINVREAPILQAFVLTMGAIILVSLTLAVNRSQQKLDLILNIILQDVEHPVTVIDKLATGPSRRRLIGYYIPSFCCITLVAWAILAWGTVFAKPPTNIQSTPSPVSKALPQSN